MGRVLLTIPENVSDFLKVGSSFRVEFFKVSTFAVSGKTGTTITVDDASGFAAGDHIWIGTNVVKIILSISTNDINFTGSIAWSNNDSVILKRDVSADNANDDYATFYDDPDFATAISQPKAVNSDNQVFGFMPPGRYGMRWSTTTATVEAHHHITFDEVTGVQVTNSNSATAGIQEAVNATPSGGGVVRVGQGTFTMTTGVTLTAGVTLQGAGRDVTTLKLADSTTLATTVGGVPCLIGADDQSTPVTIQDLTIDMNKANNTAGNNSAIVIQDVDNSVIQRCRIKDQSNTAAGNCYGILLNTTGTNSGSIIKDILFSGIGDAPDSANKIFGIFINNPVISAQVSNCYFDTCSNASGDAIHIGQGGDGFSDNIIVSGILIYIWGNPGGADTDNGIKVEDAQRVSITGCSIVGVNGNGIRVLNDGGANQGEIAISGNECGANLNGCSLGGANLTRVVVSGNNFSLNGDGAGVAIDGPTDIMVTSNMLDQNAYGVTVANSSDVYIADNKMLDNTTQAIKDNGTHTRLKIGFNVTGVTDETAMSGIATPSGAATVTVPAANTNPYIRASGACMVQVGPAETPAGTTVLTTLSDGSMVLTGTDGEAMYWRVLEVDETG